MSKKRHQMQKLGDRPPTYDELAQRVAILEIALAMEGKTLQTIQQPVGNQLVQAVNVHDVRRMNKQAFDQGFETAANISAVEYKRVFDNHAKTSHLLTLVVIVLGEIRSLVYHRDARMDNDFYRERLKYLSRELSARATDWQNTVIEVDQEYSQRTSREIVSERSPIMGIVSDTQDGIQAALKGDDALLAGVFSNHSWHEDMSAMLQAVNRGGAPSRERDHTALLRWEVSKLLKEDKRREPGQIANLLKHRYRTEQKDCEAKGIPFSPLKEKLLKKLEAAARPGDMIKRVWPE